MNLTINLTGASLDDITSIFYRLGEPGFNDVWEAEKVESLQQYLNTGCSLADALERFDADIHRKIEALEQENNQPVEPQPIPVQPVPIQPDPATIVTPPTIDPGFNPEYVDMPRIQSPVQPTNELHLDSAPQGAPTVPNPATAVNLDEQLKRVATLVVNKFGSKRLTELLEPYSARCISDINNLQKDEFLKKLQSELAG